MPTALVTAFNETHYELRAADIDFIRNTISITVDLTDSTGKIFRTITKVRSFVDLGITQAMSDEIKTRLVERLKTEGDIN